MQLAKILVIVAAVLLLPSVMAESATTRVFYPADLTTDLDTQTKSINYFELFSDGAIEGYGKLEVYMVSNKLNSILTLTLRTDGTYTTYTAQLEGNEVPPTTIGSVTSIPTDEQASLIFSSDGGLEQFSRVVITAVQRFERRGTTTRIITGLRP